MRRCMWCNRPISYLTGQGWVHSQGGGAYWQRCSHCGWEGSGIGIGQCPECGSTQDLRDDHCVLPFADEEATG